MNLRLCEALVCGLLFRAVSKEVTTKETGSRGSLQVFTFI